MAEKPTYEELERRIQELQKTESELKQIKGVLLESEERYRSLIHFSPLPFLVTQEEKIVFINPSVLNFFGIGDEGEIIGTTPGKWIHPDFIDLGYQRRRRVLENGGMDEPEELILIRKDAQEMAVLANTVRITHNGSPATLSVFQDITELRRAEDALRRNEKDLRESQRIAHVGSWRLDVATNQVVWTEELYNMCGFDPSLPPPPYTEHMKLFTPESWERLSTALAHTRETGIPYTLELETVRKDGSNGWMWVHGEADVDSAGKTVELWGAAQDITERRQATENLRKSEARHGKMVANIGDVIAIIDQDGINRYKSPNIEKLFGWKPEDVIGASTWDNVHPDDLESTREFFKKSLHTPDAVGTMECRYRCKDGSYKWIEFTGINLFHDPDIKGLLGNYQDITERKQAEEKLRKNEELLNSTQRLARIGGWDWDIERQAMSWTAETYRIHGMTPGEFAAGSPEHINASLACYDPADRQAIEAAFRFCTTDGQSYDLEFPLTRIDGSRIWIRTMASAVKQDNQVIRVIGNIMDITERLLMEQALRDSEQMYRTTFDAIPDSITVTRQKDGQYKYVNDGFCNITGYSRAETIGRTPDEINLYVNHSDRERMIQTLRQSRELLNFEISFRRKNGTIWDSFFSARPIVIDGEDCLIALTKDVTEFKRAEEEKARLENQLLQAQKMESIGRLAGGVAHDFNNMLGVILGHAELALERAEENSDIGSDLKEIQIAAQRSADLTKQLLTFARKQIIEPKMLNLNRTVKQMITMLQRLIGEDIDLIWKPAETLWSVKMDPSQIDQILVNLCVNARDAIAGVGKLTIETGMVRFDEAYCNDHAGFIPGDFVLLGVSDNGSGMDKETLNNLFEPFFTTKEMGKGTGLGLATVYGIVKQNKGFINVYSEPYQGATFKIYLPRYAAVGEIPAGIQSYKSVPGGNETILLVEDEPAILNMARMMLERKGYSVLSAATPAEAIDMAGNHTDKIHLLMTDVVMPGMNGRDLARRLTALYPDIKLLFMSGYTANAIAHQGVLDEGVAFIQKPFSMKDLADKLRGVLDH